MVRTAVEQARTAMARTERGPQEFFREWDKGSKPLRFAILARFSEKCTGMTEDEIEKFFGFGGSLVLARFCAWLRVTFGQGDSMSFQIFEAVKVFIAPVNSSRYTIEFVEQGGALTALEYLTLPNGHETTKTAALEILHIVAQAGPKFRVVLRECEAARYITEYRDGGGKDIELAQDLLTAIQQEAE